MSDEATNYELVIFGANVSGMQRMVETYTYPIRVLVVEGTAPEVTRKCHLDALVLTLMQAERFGARPPFPEGESFVLRTSPYDRERGLPPFMVAGVALHLRSPRDLREEVSIFLTEAFRAITRFNHQHLTKIRRMGVLADNLRVSELEGDALMNILRQSLGSYLT